MNNYNVNSAIQNLKEKIAPIAQNQSANGYANARLLIIMIRLLAENVKNILKLIDLCVKDVEKALEFRKVMIAFN